MLGYVANVGVSVFRQPSNFANGNTMGRMGRLVTCEHGGRRVTRTEHDGSHTVLVERYQRRRLNSPNNVVVKSDGTIWFTDPTYGIRSDYEGYMAEAEQTHRHAFRLDPITGELTSAVDDFGQPNGLAFSRDEKLLYMADSAASHDLAVDPIIRSCACSRSHQATAITMSDVNTLICASSTTPT